MKADKLVGLIPAAGSGKRLFPFAKAVPKEMYPILGKAVIEHCVENLRIGGVSKIFVIVGYQKGALMDYLGDGSLFGVKRAYIYQLDRKGPGTAILQARDWIDSTFVTLFGDSFIEPKEEIKNLIALHLKEKPIATILLFEVNDPRGYGIAKFEEDRGILRVKKLVEKPSRKQAKPLMVNGRYYAFCGAGVFEPKIFDYISKTRPGAGGEIQITDAMMQAIKDGENVNALVLKGKYIDIGKWATVFKAEKELLESHTLEFHTKEREKMAKLIQEKWGE
ncbi:MAG: sugar phosphate nucleotidyltransferase [Candidatus Hadarchaeales archaeon]